MTTTKEAPILSVVTPTLNNGKVLTFFLESIRNQDYPQDKVEILILDGGSTDNTLEIARQFGAKIYNNERVLADPGVDLGLNKATGDLMLILAVDNIYYNKNAFAALATVFQDLSIYAAFPKHVSKPTSSIYTKYINTFTDPFNHFVYGNAANARTFHKVYRTLRHTNVYDVYDYRSSRTKPMVSFAQGFTVRRGYRRDGQNSLDDVSPVMALIEQGKEIAYVHSLSLCHDTVRDFDHFVRKQRWATVNALSGKSYGIAHRKDKLSGWQRFKMRIWPVYALSIVAPFIRSCYGLYSDRELLWLCHPMMCLISVCSSLVSIVQMRFDTSVKINRQ